MFTRPKKAIGLDVGTHSVKAVLMSRSSGRLCIEEVGYAVVPRLEVSEDPIFAMATAVQEALSNMPIPQSLVVGALPGQTAVIRYPRLTNVPPEQLELAVQREAGQSIPYDLNEVFLDWIQLSESQEGDQRQLKLLLVAAKHEVIDSRLQIFSTADIQCGILSVDSLALADAAEASGFLREGETVALINIGLSSASIHFIKDGVSNFIRDVNWGSRELIQAIAKDRRIDLKQAERELLQLSESGEEAAARVAREAPQEATPLDPEVAEAVSNPFDDPFGEGSESMGGSPLDPLDDEVVDGVADGGMMDDGPITLRELLGSPLSRLVSEIRRSFDYYEHQLYEKSVDRVFLSGGVAHLPALRQIILDELGVESVEIADPTIGGLIMGDDRAMADLRKQPSLFMIAIGLAARGMAEL